MDSRSAHHHKLVFVSGAVVRYVGSAHPHAEPALKPGCLVEIVDYDHGAFSPDHPGYQVRPVEGWDIDVACFEELEALEPEASTDG